LEQKLYKFIQTNHYTIEKQGLGMGIDVARIFGDVDGDLLCPICSFVIEDPIQVCRLCIINWILTQYRLHRYGKILL
jgi:hypothetical protein